MFKLHPDGPSTAIYRARYFRTTPITKLFRRTQRKNSRTLLRQTFIAVRRKSGSSSNKSGTTQTLCAKHPSRPLFSIISPPSFTTPFCQFRFCFSSFPTNFVLLFFCVCVFRRGFPSPLSTFAKSVKVRGGGEGEIIVNQ